MFCFKCDCWFPRKLHPTVFQTKNNAQFTNVTIHLAKQMQKVPAYAKYILHKFLNVPSWEAHHTDTIIMATSHLRPLWTFFTQKKSELEPRFSKSSPSLHMACSSNAGLFSECSWPLGLRVIWFKVTLSVLTRFHLYKKKLWFIICCNCLPAKGGI